MANTFNFDYVNQGEYINQGEYLSDHGQCTQPPGGAATKGCNAAAWVN